MNLNYVIKLCNIIESGYQILAAFFDAEGNIIYKQDSLLDEHIKYYLNETKHIILQCINNKEIYITINEVAITWIGIPVINDKQLYGVLMIGPFNCHRLSEKTIADEIEKQDLDSTDAMLYMKYRLTLPCYSYVDYVRIIKLSYCYLYDKEVNEESFKIISKTILDFNLQDNGETTGGNSDIEEHGSYQFERYLWECIRMGDVDKIKNLMYSNFQFKMGNLSTSSELRSIKNLYIIGIALASRAAMEGGLNSEISYSLADVFIRQIESLNHFPEQENMVNMYYEFARRVKELSKIRQFSPNVNQCCEYIKSHVSENISVALIADYLSISHTYLSRIFKQETGLSVVDYIKKIKVKEAKFLLKFTNMSLVDISEKLAYSSQSHFNTVFKEEMSVTPKQYRDKVKVN